MAVMYPVIGDWYRSPRGDLLEVVAIDTTDGTIEVQHFDATVEELDLEAWEEASLEAAVPPEDWSGSVDIDREDFGNQDDGVPPHDWSSHLDYLDRAE